MAVGERDIPEGTELVVNGEGCVDDALSRPDFFKRGVAVVQDRILVEQKGGILMHVQGAVGIGVVGETVLLLRIIVEAQAVPVRLTGLVLQRRAVPVMP